MPGQPGEAGKEGKRVSKLKHSTGCVAWLLVGEAEGTGKAKQQLSCCLAGEKDRKGSAKRKYLSGASCGC